MTWFIYTIPALWVDLIAKSFHSNNGKEVYRRWLPAVARHYCNS